MARKLSQFEQAFVQARKQFGGSGLFYFKDKTGQNKLYSTRTKEEGLPTPAEVKQYKTAGKIVGHPQTQSTANRANLEPGPGSESPAPPPPRPVTGNPPAPQSLLGEEDQREGFYHTLGELAIAAPIGIGLGVGALGRKDLFGGPKATGEFNPAERTTYTGGAFGNQPPPKSGKPVEEKPAPKSTEERVSKAAEVVKKNQAERAKPEVKSSNALPEDEINSIVETALGKKPGESNTPVSDAHPTSVEPAPEAHPPAIVNPVAEAIQATKIGSVREAHQAGELFANLTYGPGKDNPGAAEQAKAIVDSILNAGKGHREVAHKAAAAAKERFTINPKEIVENIVGGKKEPEAAEASSSSVVKPEGFTDEDVARARSEIGDLKPDLSFAAKTRTTPDPGVEGTRGLASEQPSNELRFSGSLAGSDLPHNKIFEAVENNGPGELSPFRRAQIRQAIADPRLGSTALGQIWGNLQRRMEGGLVQGNLGSLNSFFDEQAKNAPHIDHPLTEAHRISTYNDPELIRGLDSTRAQAAADAFDQQRLKEKVTAARVLSKDQIMRGDTTIPTEIAAREGSPVGIQREARDTVSNLLERGRARGGKYAGIFPTEEEEPTYTPEEYDIAAKSGMNPEDLAAMDIRRSRTYGESEAPPEKYNVRQYVNETELAQANRLATKYVTLEKGHIDKQIGSLPQDDTVTEGMRSQVRQHVISNLDDYEPLARPIRAQANEMSPEGRRAFYNGVKSLRRGGPALDTTPVPLPDTPGTRDVGSRAIASQAVDEASNAIHTNQESSGFSAKDIVGDVLGKLKTAEEVVGPAVEKAEKGGGIGIPGILGTLAVGGIVDAARRYFDRPDVPAQNRM